MFVTAKAPAHLLHIIVPGIQSVYLPPETGGRFWAIISVKRMCHSMHVGTAAISTTTGHCGMKGVIVVDDDIRADDFERVLWALSVRYDPYRSSEMIKPRRSTPLDSALPIESRPICSRIIMDACTPFEWEKKTIGVQLDEGMKKTVQERWASYGI